MNFRKARIENLLNGIPSNRRTGATTATALGILSKAILSPNTKIKLEDPTFKGTNSTRDVNIEKVLIPCINNIIDSLELEELYIVDDTLVYSLPVLE